MSSNKVKVPFKGKMVNADEVEFEILREEWNEYKVKDGTILKFKPIIMKIFRTDVYNEDNEPIYTIRSQNVASAKVPPKLKKKTTPTPKKKISSPKKKAN